MSYLTGLKCKECGADYPADRSFFCTECLGPLEVVYDYQEIGARLSPERIAARANNLWRYRELLPITGEPITGHHSGFTPLVHSQRLGEHLGAPALYLKDDTVNHPSLSYKDRVVSVALSRGVELGYRVFACASTGNLGNALAAHCARTGFPSLIFVPKDIEAPKITGSLIYQPTLVALEGNYDDVNRLCSEIGDEYGWGFVNVNLRPYYTEGAKTFGFEIVEQLGWKLPDHVILPTAGGTLLPKVAKAFTEVARLGWATGNVRVHCAQAEGCAPVVHALHRGAEVVDPEKPKTLAKSIAIGNPADGPYVLKEVRESGGWGETATDEEIVSAIKLLAEKEGIFTEPAGGTALAVTMKLIQQGRIDPGETIVVGITGTGYKALDLFPRLEVDAVLHPRLSAFREWYEEHPLAVPVRT
ncbi:MAG TPA: threonine synthase [Vicinamibacteria bacterium]|nr:threonine synthase [Vicinamibacteria bacterium]